MFGWINHYAGITDGVVQLGPALCDAKFDEDDEEDGIEEGE